MKGYNERHENVFLFSYNNTLEKQCVNLLQCPRITNNDNENTIKPPMSATKRLRGDTKIYESV